MSEQSQTHKSMSCLIRAVILILALLGLVSCLLGTLIVGMNLVNPIILSNGTNYQFEGILSSAFFFIPAVFFFAATLVVWFLFRRK